MMDAVEQDILLIVARLQRWRQGGVFAYMVEAQLDYPRCEQTLRRDMRRMWEAGRLERIGGEGSRRGYRVPHAAAPSPETYREALAMGAPSAVIKRLAEDEVRAVERAARAGKVG